MPSSLRALSLAGIEFPVRILGRVHAFPGMTSNPLAVTSSSALARAAAGRRLNNPIGVTTDYVWVKGLLRSRAGCLRTLRSTPRT